MDDDDGNGLTAPTILILIGVLQFVPRYFEHQINNGGAASAEEKKLRTEIKQLLKEASSLTQPSTFAQAAKLKRMAAAKEKELAKLQEQQMLERKSVYDPYMKYVTPVKALTYLLLLVTFWKSPVAAISKELVQPFGGLLSWKSGSNSADKVMVGIVPWLVLCTRVSKLLCRKFITTFYNGTIGFAVFSGPLTIETVFLVTLAFSLTAALGFWRHGQLQLFSKFYAPSERVDEKRKK